MASPTPLLDRIRAAAAARRPVITCPMVIRAQSTERGTAWHAVLAPIAENVR